MSFKSNAPEFVMDRVSTKKHVDSAFSVADSVESGHWGNLHLFYRQVDEPLDALAVLQVERSLAIRLMPDLRPALLLVADASHVRQFVLAPRLQVQRFVLPPGWRVIVALWRAGAPAWRHMQQDSSLHVVAPEIYLSREELLPKELLHLPNPGDVARRIAGWTEAVERTRGSSGISGVLRQVWQRSSIMALASMRSLGVHLGMSDRTARRHVQRVMRVPGKQALQVRRMRRLLASCLDVQGRPSWVDLALSHGFYDQAHLTRSVKAMCGVSPAQMLRELRACPWGAESIRRLGAFVEST